MADWCLSLANPCDDFRGVIVLMTEIGPPFETVFLCNVPLVLLVPLARTGFIIFEARREPLVF